MKLCRESASLNCISSQGVEIQCLEVDAILQGDVVGHYFYVGKQLPETNPKFFNKMPYFKDVKD